MNTGSAEKPSILHYFNEPIADFSLPEKFTFPFQYQPHAISLLAVARLQSHLEVQQNWVHNFGLSASDETVIGKMFGVLVVLTHDGRVGYLSAFSGKVAGSNHHKGFVPPIFDGLADGGFLNAGMTELSDLNKQIRRLETRKPKGFEEEIQSLKTTRKIHSYRLQNEIYNQYHFLNQAGEGKSLRAIFEGVLYKNPPAGVRHS